MKKKDREEFKVKVGKLLRKYRKQLLISNSWKIQYEVRPRTIRDYAEVQYHYDKREFVIYINQALNLKDKELRDSIIHELFHVLLTPYTDLSGKILDNYKDGKKIRYARDNKRLHDIEERLVKKLTKIILNLEIKYVKK